MVARYRTLVTPLALVAAVILIYMENPWVFPAPGTTERLVATVAFWVLTIVVLVLMFEDRKSPGAEVVEVEGPAFARYLFSNSRAGLFWLPIRIFLGFEWAVAGWHKLTGTGWVDGGWVPPRLLAERGKGPRAGVRADHLRLVPLVSPGPH